MLEIGINLISQNQLINSYSIFTRDKVIIKNKEHNTITIGNKHNGLYYLNIIIPKNKQAKIIESIKNPIITVTQADSIKSPVNLASLQKKNQPIALEIKNKAIVSKLSLNDINKAITNNSNISERVLTIQDIDRLNKDTNNDINKEITIQNILLYQRLGHINKYALSKVLANTIAFKDKNTISPTNILSNIDNIDNCEICLRSKFTNKINKLPSNREFDLLEKISSDICGPITPNTNDNYKYFITFLDKNPRWLETELLKNKSDAYTAFVKFYKREELNSNNKRIKVLATDNGGEYINNKFKEYLINHGITQQTSAAYTPEQNGLAERINRTILNKVRALIYHANLPKYLWGEAVLAATYLYNRTPHSSLNYKTPYEVKYNRKPDISNIRTFGSICYYKNKQTGLKKLDAKANKAILIGYGESLYKVWDLEHKRAIWTRDIKILENTFISDINIGTSITPTNATEEYISLNTNTNNTKANTISDLRSIARTLSPKIRDSNIQIDLANKVANISNTQNSVDLQIASEIQEKASIYNNIGSNISELPINTPTISSNNSNIDDSIDELALLVNNESLNNEPSTYKQALLDPNKEQWLKAMKLEVDELVL